MKIYLPFFAAVALAGLASFLGKLMVRHIRLLYRAYVPEPLIGGLFIAVIFLSLRQGEIFIEVPTSGIEVDFLVALLTTNMGLHVTPQVLRKGIPLLASFLGFGLLLYFVQFLFVFPVAYLQDDSVRTAIVAGPLSFLGAPYNLNPPSQIQPIQQLFSDSFPQLKDTAQGIMMIGVLTSVFLASSLGKYFLNKKGQKAPKPSPKKSGTKKSLTSISNDITNVVVLILLIISIGFYFQQLLFDLFPAMTKDYLPLIVICYLLGALTRLGYSGLGSRKKFPEKALTVFLLGPTMNLVLSYAILSIPLYLLLEINWLLAAGGFLAVIASALVAVLLFPFLSRFTNSYYAAVIATAFFAITTAWGPVGMSYLRRFMDEEGPVEPMPVVLPLNAFFIFPWLVVFLTQLLL